jgi:hypothetical protein
LFRRKGEKKGERERTNHETISPIDALGDDNRGSKNTAVIPEGLIGNLTLALSLFSHFPFSPESFFRIPNL